LLRAFLTLSACSGFMIAVISFIILSVSVCVN
jgi:hypothetical protein